MTITPFTEVEEPAAPEPVDQNAALAAVRGWYTARWEPAMGTRHVGAHHLRQVMRVQERNQKALNALEMLLDVLDVGAAETRIRETSLHAGLLDLMAGLRRAHEENADLAHEIARQLTAAERVWSAIQELSKETS